MSRQQQYADFAVYLGMALGLLMITDYFTFSKTISVADLEMQKRVERTVNEFELEQANQLEITNNDLFESQNPEVHSLENWDDKLVLARLRRSPNLFHAQSTMLF